MEPLARPGQRWLPTQACPALLAEAPWQRWLRHQHCDLHNRSYQAHLVNSSTARSCLPTSAASFRVIRFRARSNAPVCLSVVPLDAKRLTRDPITPSCSTTRFNSSLLSLSTSWSVHRFCATAIRWINSSVSSQARGQSLLRHSFAMLVTLSLHALNSWASVR